MSLITGIEIPRLPTFLLVPYHGNIRVSWSVKPPKIMNLADPQLELIDPTPNIHALFLHFDKTFFWGNLAGRCVIRWSKRMYSCAGICSYEGRGGLCDIALSEPLLKLRTRKDLVETLLHEMIHAFLFITRQDQDRDGHGPNFQAHMYRINGATGLNITIYHEFHDEVLLYQTHWWRCTGICQFQRPHFGIVRRSNNRQPGPSDYWWESHRRCCGGIFIKIKEPSKQDKKTKKTNVLKPNADIKKYINTSSDNNNNNQANNKSITQNDKTDKSLSKDTSNIIIKAKVSVNKDNTRKIVVSNETVKNIPLLLTSQQSDNGDCSNTNPAGVVDTVRKIWANKKILRITVKQLSNDNSTTETNQHKHKTDYPVETPPAKLRKIDDYFKTTATSVLKDLYGQDFQIAQSKDDQKLKAVPKQSLSDRQDVDTTQSKVDEAIPEQNHLVECPVCNGKIDSDKINRHLDECLNRDIIEKLSSEGIPSLKIDSGANVEDNSEQSRLGVTGVDGVASTSKTGKKTLNKENLKDKDHNRANSVIKNQVINNNVIDLTNIGFVTNANQTVSGTDNSRAVGEIICLNDNKLDKERKSVNFEKPTTSNNKNNLIENTSQNVISPPIVIEPGCSTSDTTSQTACPCCGSELNESVNDHLDECLSFFENNTTIPEEGTSTNYIDGTVVIDDNYDDEFDESLIFNDTGTKLPCPCCLDMIEEVDMNRHLDACLS